MTYTPSETEKRTTVLIQALAAVFFFIPPLVAWKMKRVRSSPYVKYWAKTCLVWSLLSTLTIVVGTAATILLELPVPTPLLAIVHFVFCIIGGLSSYFNTPFRYWFVANKFCEPELRNVYGQLMVTPGAAHK